MKKDKNFPWTAVNTAITMGVVFVISIGGAVLLGRWLDGRYGTAPWGFITITFLVFILVMIYITFKSLDLMNQIEREGEEDKHAQ